SIIAIETDIDHVHVFVSAPPRYSPAWIANLLKGYTSRMLRLKFPFIKRTSAYYVGTAGAVSSETIIRYITECRGK
ncbi:MAG: IS200/IS605 family transposase, partial [Candidatus Neptunochlamydia sp.]|nr:IS200/IS605 family transposase [Candidatus Neptunochlamydia sp.]